MQSQTQSGYHHYSVISCQSITTASCLYLIASRIFNFLLDSIKSQGRLMNGVHWLYLIQTYLCICRAISGQMVHISTYLYYGWLRRLCERTNHLWFFWLRENSILWNIRLKSIPAHPVQGRLSRQLSAQRKQTMVGSMATGRKIKWVKRATLQSLTYKAASALHNSLLP